MLALGIIKDIIREPAESKITIQAYFEQLYAKNRNKKRNGQILKKQKYQNTRKEIDNLHSLF